MFRVVYNYSPPAVPEDVVAAVRASVTAETPIMPLKLIDAADPVTEAAVIGCAVVTQPAITDKQLCLVAEQVQQALVVRHNLVQDPTLDTAVQAWRAFFVGANLLHESMRHVLRTMEAMGFRYDGLNPAIVGPDTGIHLFAEWVINVLRCPHIKSAAAVAGAYYVFCQDHKSKFVPHQFANLLSAILATFAALEQQAE